MFSDHRGFTLIEVIVMASIATIGVLSTLVVANLTLQTSDANERRVAATNLAREGIEMVRAARDSDWQAYDRQVQAGRTSNLQKWDCYVSSSGQATSAPPGCDGNFGYQPGTNSPATSPINYVAYPNVGNGVPYFVSQSGGTAGTTTNTVYLICPGQGSNPPIYVPTTASVSGGNLCGVNGAQPFYRRITVQRGKDLGGGKYNLFVKVYVTWPGRTTGDLTIEEYLTDWRKFS